MYRVQLTSELVAFIADSIQRFGAESPENRRWLSRHVAEFGALPLYLGWFETIGIRPDGGVVRWSTEDEYAGVKDIEDQTWLITALVTGARQYPELQPLIPKRGESDVDCPCFMHPRFKSGELICNVCGGTGWVAPHEKSTH